MLKRLDKTETLPPVRPNAGFEAAYRRRLMALINAMQADVKAQIERCYRDNTPEIAQDESPAMALRNLMKRLTVKWLGKFDEAAKGIAKYFATSAAERSDKALAASLRKGGFSVKFKLTAPVNDVIQATIGENVALIKSIPAQHLADVEGMVMRSVIQGGDLRTLSKGLADRYGITKRRAAFIARDQNNKMTANITRVRQLDLGITEAIWLHSAHERNPRPAHVAFSGHKYNIKDGEVLDGVQCWPGTLPNCKCVSVPVIKGFNG